MTDTGLDRRKLLRLAAGGALGGMLAPGLLHAQVRGAGQDIMASQRAVLRKWTASGVFPGLVATLGLRGELPRVAAYGTHGFTDQDPMGADTLFRIYSMTKPVTGMAAMELISRGRMALDQPLHDVLPEFRDMWVQDSYDGALDRVHRAKTPITMRHLLTHTAGLSYAIVQQGPIRDLLLRKGLSAGLVTRIRLPGLDWGTPIRGLDAFARELAKVPLVREPGRTWIYSASLDVMGRVIEVVSGRPLDAFLAETIFGPAGMDSTFFHVPAAQAGRLASNYAVLQGLFLPVDGGADSVFLDPPPMPFGGSGLVSSPRDYDRFLRLLAQDGTIGGRRVLSAEAVRLGTSDLLPSSVPKPVYLGRRGGFGAGGFVGSGADAGTFGWSGAAGTIAMVDRSTGVRSAFYAQHMPASDPPVGEEYLAALQKDLAALTKGQ